MKQKNITAKQIAKWFIDRASKSTAFGGEFLTQLKLQKLMYYAKGFYYVLENQPLFKDKIVSQKLGPVVPALVPSIKPFGYDTIKSCFENEPDIKDEKILKFLEFVFDKVGQFAARKLVDLTHAETPWQNTKIGKEITPEAISNFFKENYIHNFNHNNPFGITEEDIINFTFSQILKDNEEAFLELAK